MSNTIDLLIKRSKHWSSEIKSKEPEFFKKGAEGQQPEVLWIGCSDSRVPVELITEQGPGAIFVQRNIANMVVHSDTNLLSVIFYAVKALKVKHIVVCGHYGCGGAAAAMGRNKIGYIDTWLNHLKDVYRAHAQELESIDEDKRLNRFVELNVQEQVHNLARINFVQEELGSLGGPQIHGLVYDLPNGELKDLGMTVKSKEDLDEMFRYA